MEKGGMAWTREEVTTNSCQKYGTAANVMILLST